MNAEDNEPSEFKVMMLGECGVGKSSLTNRFLNNCFGRAGPEVSGAADVDMDPEVEVFPMFLWFLNLRVSCHSLSAL